MSDDVTVVVFWVVFALAAIGFGAMWEFYEDWRKHRHVRRLIQDRARQHERRNRGLRW